MGFTWFDSVNARWVLTGCVFLGISSGVLGSFAMLRRRSLLGDVLAHAALPGVCIAFLLTGMRSLPVLMVGALIAGLTGAFCMQFITRYSRVKDDAALGIVLSVFFAFGIVLLTKINQSGNASQAGLDKFLFGQAASLVGKDVYVMATCAIVICVLSILLFKEFKLLCFDPGFASGIGFSTFWLDVLLNLLIVWVVAVGLQAVGVVLIVAMLITPAAAARLWTDRLNWLIGLAGAIGGITGAVGTVLSGIAPRMPTGPLIVLSATAVFVFSLVFAPRRGLLAKAVRLMLVRRRVARENVLRALYELAEAAGAYDSAVTEDDLASYRSQSATAMKGQLASLESEKLILRSDGKCRLTENGHRSAYEIVRNHRLWEMFLMHEQHLGVGQIDRDADEIEHYLTSETVQELERLLEVHGRSPQLLPSPHPIGG